MPVHASPSAGLESDRESRDAAPRRGAPSAISPPVAPARARLIVALLFLFMAINFADKAVIGIAAVPIMRDLRLTPSQFGLIGSSFFLLFSLSAIVTGFIVNHVQTRWALLVMALVWALTQFPMMGNVGFGAIVACRIVLGAGEGPAAPVALHAVYKWYPNEVRTLPTAIIIQGGAVGVMATLPLLNWVLVRYSWQWAFGALGIAGLAWAAAWLIFGREGAVAAAAPDPVPAAPERAPYRQLLLSPTILACWCATFAAYWGLSQTLSWQGAFLIKGLGLAQASIGVLGALPPAASVVLVIAAGWYSQRLLSRGVPSRAARGVLGGVCVALGGAALVVMPYAPGIAAKVGLTTLGVALPTVIYVISNAVIGEVTPAAQRGALLAIGTAVATSAGLLAPFVMGRVIERAATPLAGFNTGFMICGMIMLVGGAIGMALIRPEREAARHTRQLSKPAAEPA